MPKMKTHASSKKRFKVTGSGNLKVSKPGTRHLAPGKTQKQKRHMRKQEIVSTSDVKRIRKQLANIL